VNTAMTIFVSRRNLPLIGIDLLAAGLDCLLDEQRQIASGHSFVRHSSIMGNRRALTKPYSRSWAARRYTS
jgi:hypothetical protein